MRLHLSDEYIAQFDDAQPAVQKAVLKQLKLLKSNIRHPSLHAKKFDETEDIWQARINKRVGACTSKSRMTLTGSLK